MTVDARLLDRRDRWLSPRRLAAPMVIAAGLVGCLSGRPSSAQCTDADDCAPGEICQVGACLLICQTHADCGAGGFCNGGLCLPSECSVDGDCNQPGACEIDEGATCRSGECIFAPIADGAECDDGDPCTEQDSCGSGQCRGEAVACTEPPAAGCSADDSVYVAYPDVGTCNSATAVCDYVPFELDCPSCADACLGACETIRCPDANGGCLSQGVCNPATLSCTYTARRDGTACDLPAAPLGSAGGVCTTGTCVTPAYAWIASEFGACSNSCGAGVQTRAVVCRDLASGGVVADSFCAAAAKPATSQACTATIGCTYAWETSAWSACSTACGTGSQTRTAVCKNTADSQPAPDTSCTATKPATTQTCTDTSGCSYAWQASGWGSCSTSCGNGTQYQSVVCRNTGTGETVADANCTATKPATSQPCTDTSGCTFAWQTSGWGSCSTTCGVGTQAQTVTCRNVSLNQTANDASCPPPKPATSQSCTEYGGCTYTWSMTSWSACTPACSTSGTQVRSVTCRRSFDNAIVADGYCTETKPTLAQSCANSSCTIGWVTGPTYTVPANNTAVYGNGDVNTVTIPAGITNVTIDQNVETVELMGASSSYAFKQSGNGLNIYNLTGVTLFATIYVRENGTELLFTNGKASTAWSPVPIMTLGGTVVSDAVPTPLSPTLTPR